jgi:hypothetical protein
MNWQDIKNNVYRIMAGDAVLIEPPHLKRFTSYFKPGKLSIEEFHGSYIVKLKEVKERERAIWR